MSKQHVHKLRRIDMGREKAYWVMQCSLPGCTTYFPMRSKISCPSLLGKISLCNSCGDRFIMDRRSLRLSKPTCSSCVSSPKQAQLDKAKKFFTSLEGELEDILGAIEDDAG